MEAEVFEEPIWSERSPLFNLPDKCPWSSTEQLSAVILAVMAEQNFPAICFSSQLDTTEGESLEIQRKEICVLYYWWCLCCTEEEGKFKCKWGSSDIVQEIYGKEKKKRKKKSWYVDRTSFLCTTDMAFPDVFMYYAQQDTGGSQRHVLSKCLIAMLTLVHLIAWLYPSSTQK